MSADTLAACVALDVSDLDCREHAPQYASVGLPFIVAALRSRDALRRARPNLAAFCAALPIGGADAIFLYVRQGYRLDARMFSPLDGIVEDPATGSATAATIALLASLEQPSLDREWQVHQGEDMGRPSRLSGRTRPAALGPETYVGGHCVAMLAGSFEL